MSGERNLSNLKKKMAPRMHEGVFVYCTIPTGELPPGMTPICSFQEDEGLTVIVEKAQAEASGMAHVFEARLITLTVHSSLEAVGLLATLAGRFSSAGIPCNVVSAFHHDHFFVPIKQAAQAMDLLAALSEETESADHRVAD